MDRTEILKRIRAYNLDSWGRRLGRTTLAAKVGDDDCNHLNQLIGLHGSFGNKVAEKYELALDLPALWMDFPHRGLWTVEQRSVMDEYLSPIISFASDTK